MKTRSPIFIVLIPLLLFLAIALTGCSDSKPTTPSTPAPITQQEQQTKSEQPTAAVSQSSVQAQQQSETKATTLAPQTTTPTATVNTPAPEAQKKETIVYITRTGHKYHRDGCRYLSRSQIPISLSDAKAQGYGPCSVCGPPQ